MFCRLSEGLMPNASAVRSGYCISHALRQERSEYTWFSLLEKANASSNGRAFAFLLQGFQGMRRSEPVWRYSIRFSQRP